MKVFSTALGIVFAVATPGFCSTLDFPLVGTVTGFTTYVGQTFTPPAGDARLDRLSVYVGPSPDSGFAFHLLVTGTTGGLSGNFHPTDVLFDSGRITMPFSGLFTTQRFDFEIGGLALVPGEQYAWVLDHATEYSGSYQSSSIGYANLAAFGEDPPYAGGFAFGRPPSPFPPSGTRAENFAEPWIVDRDSDLAFRADFSGMAPVPLPASVVPLASLFIGLLAMGLGSRNRRAAAA